jgi:hypothetical protein
MHLLKHSPFFGGCRPHIKIAINAFTIKRGIHASNSTTATTVANRQRNRATEPECARPPEV